MKLGKGSSLTDVAIATGDALRRTGIRAVLTGGACANLYSKGTYQSSDADFVLTRECGLENLDRALAPLGFVRKGTRYVHQLVPFFVEFPTGPLGIGQDLGIKPVWRSRGSAKTLALSATDACRDRLAAFYHWNDQQSLGAAVAIALHHHVSFAKVRSWSAKEGHTKGYGAFLAELRRARTQRSGRRNLAGRQRRSDR